MCRQSLALGGFRGSASLNQSVISSFGKAGIKQSSQHDHPQQIHPGIAFII